jgi:hexosaminidase
MKNKIFLLIPALLSFYYSSKAQHANPVIPAPSKIQWGKGNFIFTSCTRLQLDQKDNKLQEAMAPLVRKLKNAATIDLVEKGGCGDRLVTVSLTTSVSNGEGYKLLISPQKIAIVARKPAGVFYAVQTLLQLLPEAIESSLPIKGVHWLVPCVQIEDAPRFPYRGIMLDVSRHYMQLDSIKRIIDFLAMQKMNRFHWHLTDNDGWRFESRKYPKLTTIGAYRKGSPVHNRITYNYNSLPDEPVYGGYYTQEQMKEVVDYAARRYITVIPEIEMPAHAMAAIAAYPQLACLDSNGREFPYPQQIQGEFCTKDETFTFLTDILSEVIDIFPSRYLHIGGDEADKLNWRTCQFCVQRMKQEGLKNVHELQSYFIKRIEKFVNSRGRSIIGWDEIMEGGAAPNAGIMSWTGVKNGMEAARNNHEVVMTPLPYCYFDHFQSDAPGEPDAYSGLTMLSNVYQYEPLPKELDKQKAKYITGAQGNLWTEYVPTAYHAEYMLFPRSTALAEVTWSQPSNKGYSDFIRRLRMYNKRWNRHSVHYSTHMYDIRLGNIKVEDGKYKVTISVPKNSNPVYYTLDGSVPTGNSAIYKRPISIMQSCKLTAAIMMNGRIVDLADKKYILHKGIGKKGFLKILPDFRKGDLDAWHNGSLCDDKRMNDERYQDEERYNDDKWVGWDNQNFDGTLDFGKEEIINKINMRFYHNIPYGILIPKSVTVQASDDGLDFRNVFTQAMKFPDSVGAIPLHIALPGIQTRYLRIIAEPYGKTPAGNNASLFVDEVIVE